MNFDLMIAMVVSYVVGSLDPERPISSGYVMEKTREIVSRLNLTDEEIPDSVIRIVIWRLLDMGLANLEEDDFMIRKSVAFGGDNVDKE